VAREIAASVRSRFILTSIARVLPGVETKHADGLVLETLPSFGTISSRRASGQFESADQSHAGTGVSYSSRSADEIGNRAARIAGNNPPRKPIISAQTSPCVSSAGVTWNAKAIWLNELKFIVDVS